MPPASARPPRMREPSTTSNGPSVTSPIIAGISAACTGSRGAASRRRRRRAAAPRCSRSSGCRRSRGCASCTSVCRPSARATSTVSSWLASSTRITSSTRSMRDLAVGLLERARRVVRGHHDDDLLAVEHRATPGLSRQYRLRARSSPGGGMGRRGRLKIAWPESHAGSSPAPGTAVQSARATERAPRSRSRTSSLSSSSSSASRPSSVVRW